MKQPKTYTVKELEALTGLSKQRISQLCHGYKCKGYTYPALLQEATDFTYHRTNIQITTTGKSKLLKYLKTTAHKVKMLDAVISSDKKLTVRMVHQADWTGLKRLTGKDK